MDNAPQPVHPQLQPGEGMQQRMQPHPAPQQPQGMMAAHPMQVHGMRSMQPPAPQEVAHQPAPRPVTHPALAQASMPRPSFTHTPASANSTESAVGVHPAQATMRAAPARPIQPGQPQIARPTNFANVEAASHPNGGGQSSGGGSGNGMSMPRMNRPKPKGTGGGSAEGGAAEGGAAEAGAAEAGTAAEAGSAIEGIGEIAAVAAL